MKQTKEVRNRLCSRRGWLNRKYMLQETTGESIRGILPAALAYDLAAVFYDRRRWTKFWELNEKPKVLTRLSAGKDAVILDLGCGTGLYALELARRGNTVYGVDVSEGMLNRFAGKIARLAIQKRRRIRLARGDGEQLGIKSGVIDSVIATRMMSHVRDPSRIFAEIERVLRPGGTMIVTDLHEAHPYEHTTLEDPVSGQRVAVETYKRPVTFYVEEAKRAGLHLIAAEEVSYEQCEWRPREEFPKLNNRPELPIFFLLEFGK